MPSYISKEYINILKKVLSLSVVKKKGNIRTSSIAISSSGKSYKAGLIESDTNTFNIPSEHIALMLSTISNDYRVVKIITMVEKVDSQNYISPMTLKIIKDYSIRSGLDIEYTIVDIKGKILLNKENITDLIPYYNPEKIILSRTNQEVLDYKYTTTPKDRRNIPNLLKKYAILGLNKNFPLYDSASGYAAAVLTKSGKLFFAGQYSSPDKRLGLHSEVNSIISAIMNKDFNITHIGLVSTKYFDTPCNMCGNCRQFISEMAQNFNFEPKIYLFSKESSDYKEQDINDYLPSSWSSKKWESK